MAQPDTAVIRRTALVAMLVAVQTTLDTRARVDALIASNARDATIEHRNQELRALNSDGRSRDAAELATVLRG